MSVRADEFALRERGIDGGDLSPGVASAALDFIIDRMAAGAVVGFAFSRLLGGYVHDVRLPGMLPLIGSVGVIIGATVIASALPAVRAARVDVMQALRSD